MCIGLKVVYMRVRRMQKHLPFSQRDTEHSIRKRTSKSISLSVLIAFGFSYLPYIILVVYVFIVGETPMFVPYIEEWAEL